MDTKIKTVFPVVITQELTEGNTERFSLVEKPEDLPTGISFVIFATNADLNMAVAIRKAYVQGIAEGLAKARDQARSSKAGLTYEK